MPTKMYCININAFPSLVQISGLWRITAFFVSEKKLPLSKLPQLCLEIVVECHTLPAERASVTWNHLKPGLESSPTKMGIRQKIWVLNKFTHIGWDESTTLSKVIIQMTHILQGRQWHNTDYFPGDSISQQKKNQKSPIFCRSRQTNVL